MSKKLLNISLLVSSLICTAHLNAQTDDLLASISSEMEHYNEVATITKQNELYQPFVISVFQGKELEKLGVVNLKEALGLVPGVDMATDSSNTQTPIFRGSNPLASGQSKLFIDGTLVNNVFFDAYSEYLSFPIEMIKRIEVVRGPGSKTDGVNAYAGSINVITYAEDFEGFESSDKLVFKYGSYDYKMGGFVKTYKMDDFKIFIDFYYQEDDKSLYAGPDALSQGVLSIPALGLDNTGISQTGDAPVWIEEYALGLNITYKDFSLKARILDHTEGSAYGINLALPQDSDRLKRPSKYIELGYNKEINNYKIDIKAGVKFGTYDSYSKLTPDGLEYIDMIQYAEDGSIIPITFTDGVYGEHLAKQRSLYQSSYFKYHGIKNHLITIGYRYTKEETIEVVSKLSDRSTGDVGLVDYTDTLPFFDKDAMRETYIFSLQDEFQFNNALNFIYGFNYEQTSYKNAGIEPRVSMVYQYNSKYIFKAIYSRSHRNPSWQEMFTMNNSARVGSTELEPERVDAFEFAHIQKLSSDTHIQANIFYLINKDQIYNTSTDPVFRNVVDTDLYGFELEYKGNISSADQLYINYSHVHGDSYIKDEDKSEHISNVASHLAKAYYIYDLTPSLSLSGIAKYVGSKERVSGDTREKVKAYSTFDTSIRYNNKSNNYTIALSVKNLFNAVVKYPSTPNTYYEDYTQEDRSFIVTLKKEF